MIDTKFHFSGGDMTVENIQDVEPHIDYAKMMRDQAQHKADFHHKWNLPNVMVTKFYNEYADGMKGAPAMDSEFWAFVDRKMDDPDYAKFRTDNPSSPFFFGYRK